MPHRAKRSKKQINKKANKRTLIPSPAQHQRKNYNIFIRGWKYYGKSMRNVCLYTHLAEKSIHLPTLIDSLTHLLIHIESNRIYIIIATAAPYDAKAFYVN